MIYNFIEAKNLFLNVSFIRSSGIRIKNDNLLYTIEKAQQQMSSGGGGKNKVLTEIRSINTKVQNE
jgi:hypothetical protein